MPSNGNEAPEKRGEIRSLAVNIARGICLGLLAVIFASPPVAAGDSAVSLSNPDRSSSLHEYAAVLLSAEVQTGATPLPKRADFKGEERSWNAQSVANWVVHSGDNHGMPFVIIDKVDAKVFVFHADGQIRGAAPVLLGLGRGDESAPDIGERKLSDISPEERITPAGRFVASLGYNFNGKDVLWVDYDEALSLHRVVTSNPKERRLERLATPTPLDNRISFGCINVPERFYNEVVSPAFAGTYGVVYVLPEVRSNKEVFTSYYDVEREPRTDISKPSTNAKGYAPVDLKQAHLDLRQDLGNPNPVEDARFHFLGEIDDSSVSQSSMPLTSARSTKKDLPFHLSD